MAETMVKRAQPPAPGRRTKVYAFASKAKPGLWRCPLVRGLIEREDVEALARAIGAEVVFVDHRPAVSESV